MFEKPGSPLFRDREEGARLLARELGRYSRQPQSVVLGLPRGGVVTAAVVAEELGLPLDVLVVRKLGTPGRPELAMGAIASGGVRVLNEDVIRMLRVDPKRIEQVVAAETAELQRREVCFRGALPPADVAGKTVIVVDDGLATGATMAAAVDVLRNRGAAHIVVAAPVAPPEMRDKFRAQADEVVCVAMPEPFVAVGYWYEEFPQVEDDEVVDILRRATRASSTPVHV